MVLVPHNDSETILAAGRPCVFGRGQFSKALEDIWEKAKECSLAESPAEEFSGRTAMLKQQAELGGNKPGLKDDNGKESDDAPSDDIFDAISKCYHGYVEEDGGDHHDIPKWLGLYQRLKLENQRGEMSDGMSEKSQELTPEVKALRRELLGSFAPLFDTLDRMPEVDTLPDSGRKGSTRLELRAVSMGIDVEGKRKNYVELDPDTNVIRSRKIREGDESIGDKGTADSVRDDDNTSAAPSLYEEYQATTASSAGTSTTTSDVQRTVSSEAELLSLSEAFSKVKERWAWPKQTLAKAT
jgi:hypothetical protein